jgi:mevalonate pyrophosphate decarboxylase
MMSASYNMERRGHEAWNTYNVERMEAHKTSANKLGHFQKWMKNIEQKDMSEGIKNEEIFTFFEAYMGFFENNHVYT